MTLGHDLHLFWKLRRARAVGALEVLESELPNEPRELVEVSSARQAVLESVEAFLVPATQHFLRRPGQIRNVDLDGVLLADAIEASDPLLEELRTERQVEENEVVRELKIPAFASDLGANQEAATRDVSQSTTSPTGTRRSGLSIG